MPFKSKAQRRKFAQLWVEGKITDEAYERWNKETGGAELPERVVPPKEAQAKPKPKAKPGPKAKGKTRSKAKAKPASTRKSKDSRP